MLYGFDPAFPFAAPFAGKPLQQFAPPIWRLLVAIWVLLKLSHLFASVSSSSSLASLSLSLCKAHFLRPLQKARKQSDLCVAFARKLCPFRSNFTTEPGQSWIDCEPRRGTFRAGRRIVARHANFIGPLRNSREVAQWRWIPSPHCCRCRGISSYARARTHRAPD